MLGKIVVKANRPGVSFVFSNFVFRKELCEKTFGGSAKIGFQRFQSFAYSVYRVYRLLDIWHSLIGYREVKRPPRRRLISLR